MKIEISSGEGANALLVIILSLVAGWCFAEEFGLGLVSAFFAVLVFVGIVVRSVKEVEKETK